MEVFSLTTLSNNLENITASLTGDGWVELLERAHHEVIVRMFHTINLFLLLDLLVNCSQFLLCGLVDKRQPLLQALDIVAVVDELEYG